MKLYLSRLLLSPANAQVRAELRSPYEMHRTLSKAFPFEHGTGGGDVVAERVLFRVDPPTRSGAIPVLVQSRNRPDWSALTASDGYHAEPPAVKEFEPSFAAGQRFAFRLRANPTVKRNGKRFGLYGEREQAEWLHRKGAQGGFVPERFGAVIEDRMLRMERKDDRMEFLAVRFDGVLRVLEPEALLATLATGIGSAKAFGFGLLSLAPIRD
ncbi:MAG TPA: type I-E CRISPR-associated protein Cas6/Cse3/CasE [Longimicrobiales bacterium]